MAQITDRRKLFLHELGDILFVEQKLANEVLPKLIREVQDRELRQGLTRHHKQTQKHVTNVERVFKQLGEAPKAEECVGFVGLKNEHDKLLGEASRELVDSIDTGAAARTEHYEIAAYQGLIAMARGLGNSAVVPLLQENLSQEREALRELEKVSRRLAKQQKDNGSPSRARSSTRTSRSRGGTRTRRTARAGR